MSHEILYRKKRHGVTVLLDLKAFYENVSHHTFVAQALALEVPPLILNAAISLYSAPRWISAEKCISGPIKPTKGLVAGCPFAPGLSKIPFDSILRPAWNTGLAKTIDLYVDDTSFDTEAASPELAARRAAQLYKAVVGGLEQAGLPISIGKTAFVCSSRKVEAALKGYLPASEQIKDAAKDLGIDCTAGRRRRIPVHRKRFGKGVRRMSLGSVDLTIDHAAPKRPDPAYTIISQHFKAIHRLLCFIPDRQKQHFEDILPDMWMEYQQAENPWKRAAGPVGALLCYLVDLGWTPVSASAWKCPEDTCQITTKVGMHHLLCSLALETDRWRHTRIAQQDSLSPLLTGIDWHPLKKLRSRLPPQHKTSLMAVWQGAIRADPCATCLTCGCAATLNHVLWECSWWLTNLPEPPAFERFRKEWPISSLWSRGMTPATSYPDDGQWVRTTGAWNESQLISGEGVYFATDGSPGRSKDVRFHRYTWAAIAFRLDDAEPAVIATAVGTLQTPLSVFRAEAAAVKFVAEHTQGDVDLTMDCKGILPRIQGKPSIHSADLFEPIREHSHRIRPTWIASHLSVPKFIARFGANQLWRRRANELVDRLVGEAAEQRRDPIYESSIKKLDAVITQVNTLLAKRSAALFSYDKDQGPQVQWPDEDQRKARAKPRVRDSAVIKTKKFSKEKGPNKRLQLENLIAGKQQLGHAWVEGSRKPSNLTAKCSKCGLYIQQTDPIHAFSVKSSHPCLGVPADPPPWGPHPDHVWVNLGVSWVCSKCDRMVKVGARKIPSWIGQPCKPNVSKAATASSKKAKEVTDTGVRSVKSFFQPTASQEPHARNVLPKPKPKSKSKQSGLNPPPPRRRRVEPQDEQAPEPGPQHVQPPEPLVDNQAQGMRNPGVVLRENPQLEQHNPVHRPPAVVANQAERDEAPGIVLRENPHAPGAGPVLGAPDQDSCSEESEEEPMVPDPIVHPEPPPAPPAAPMLPAPLNFDAMDQEAGAAFAIAERARNTKPGLVAFKSDLGYAGVFQALPKDLIHVWFNDTGDSTAAYIHNGRTRYGYDVGGGYVLKVGTKQAFGDEVAISALLPKVAATIIGAGSTTLQVLLSGRPWEFRSHLVAC
ncbi:unnamed protein product [Symbiodinium natans]|uniref:Reverse transcriptase domain-containing protein n=1 Tax=Symbiodinium natans TaxID=878477 RepID=A0A812PN14_9DINO|nr:unnamed protein product [Symbiodinium natans]